MTEKYDYHYNWESGKFNFYRIPKTLILDPIFASLSAEAKLLYGLMLDRMELSKKSGWVDDYNRVYIYYAYRTIQEHMGCGKNKPTKLLRELEEHGLIHRIRQGQGKPDRIYVMNFVTDNNQSHNSGAQNTENRASGSPKTGIPNSLGPGCNYTEKIDTKNIDTNQSLRINYVEDAIELLKYKWGYIALLDTFPADTLDNIILLGADILCGKKETIRVAGENMAIEQVKSRLLSLDMTHIDYVLESVSKTEKEIKNLRAYLLTALYYAPTTIDAYYEALFRKNELKAS